MKVIVAVLGLATTFEVASPARDLIVNGSFEVPAMAPATIEDYPEGATNIVGWVVLQSNRNASRMTTGYVVYPNVNPAPVWTPFGSTVFDTDNYIYRGNAIAQSFPTTPSGAYRVVFSGSREPWQIREWFPTRGVALEVSVAYVTNVYRGDFDASLEGGMNWKSYVFSFIATANLSTLTFRQTEGLYEYEGACLDDVHVYPVREPELNREGQICFLSEVGKVYKIESVASLDAPSELWDQVGTEIPGTGDVICRQIGVASTGSRFYRLVELPGNP